MRKEISPEIMLEMFPFATTLHRAFLASEPVMVSRFIEEEFQVEIRHDQLMEIMQRGGKLCLPWSNESWRIWIKNRLCEFGLFDPGSSSPSNDRFKSATRLWIFLGTKNDLIPNETICEPVTSTGFFSFPKATLQSALRVRRRT